MKKQILLALIFSFTYLGLHAQCNDPFPPANSCANVGQPGGVPVICDLDGYCSTTGPANAINVPSTFCGSVQNNQWFAFVAGSTNIELEFIVGACNGTANGTGLQAAVYTMCGAPWTQLACTFQITPGNSSPMFLNGLTPGNVYYLMIDGFSGDICDYTIEVNNGSTTAPPITNNGGIMGDLTFCPGASSVTYTLPPATGAGFYNWTIPAGATIVGDDQGSTIVIDFTGSTGGQICVTPSNGCEDGPPECITVTQGPPPTTPDVTFNLCPGQTATYGNTTYSTQSPPGGFPNTDIQNAQGCDILTNVIVNIGQVYNIMLDETICFDDPPIVVGGVPLPPVTGVYPNNLLTSLGCDSIVTVNLTVLTPAAAATQPNDIDCGPNLIVPLEAVVLNPSPTITYEWFGPCVTQIGLPNGTSDPIEGAACPGTYTLVVSETQNGVVCSTQPFTVVVGENTTPPIADAGTAQVIGCGTSAAVLGGPNTSLGPNFAYAWTGPAGLLNATTANPTAVNSGQYCLQVINTVTACQSTVSCVDVTGDLTPPVAVAGASATTLTCTTTSSTLSTTGSSGGGGVMYSWTGPNGALSGNTPSVSQSGTYTLTVTGDNGCTNTATVDIGSDTQDPTAVIDTPASLDCNNVSVSLNGSNSTGGNLSYSWSGVASGTDPTSSASTSGMATLTVTNMDNGCTNQVSVMVDDNSSVISVDIDVPTQLTCTNNQVTLSAINLTGTSNPTYVWTGPNGETGSGPTINAGAAGMWSLEVIDNTNGCTSGVVSEMVIENGNLPTAVAGVSGDITCVNPTVTLSTAGSSTGGSFTSAWTLNGNAVNDPNNINTAGTYELLITDSSNGCTATAQIVVNEDTADPTAIIDTPNAIDCNNTSITLNGANSTGANLSYSWSGVGSGTNPTTSVASGGMATLTVTNMDNGCTDQISVNVDDNTTVITAEIDVPAQLTCTNNQVTLSAINVSGTTNPTYVWTGPNGETGSGPTINAGSAGMWTVEVIDNSTGCTSGAVSEMVVENGNLPTAVAGVSGDITCTNGTVVLSTAGSSTGGTITATWTLNNQPVSDPNNITTAGTYELLITDTSNGCTAEAQIIVNEDTTVPNAVIATPLPIDCNNTSISLNGSGSTGGPNLSLAWTLNGQTIDPNNISVAGTYVLTVTNDDNGCVDTEQIVVDDLTTTVEVTANSSGILDCSGNPVMLDVVTLTGTTNPVYTWVDDNNMVVSQGSDPMTPVGAAGTYTLTVEDATTGCSASTNVVVLEDTNIPDAIVANPDNLTCVTTTVTLDGTSSSSGNNITYQWIDGNGNIPNATNPTLDVTVAGNYSLLVTDISNGCSQISAVVDVILDNATPQVSAIPDNNGELSCTTTSLNIDASGTTGNNLEFEWTDANGNIIGTGPVITVSAAGDVTATATNTVNGCSASQIVSIIPNADLPQINVDPVDQLDCTNNSSTLTGTGASTTGGTVTLEWFDDNMMLIPGSNTGSISTTAPGDYTFVVTDDGSGCSQSAVVTVVEDLAQPMVNAGMNQTIDCDNDMVTLNGSGSQSGPNITYQWFDQSMVAVPGGNTAIISTTTPGDYTLVVTNTDNGCSSEQLINVNENIEAPVFTASALNNIDCNNMEATMEAVVSSSFSTNLQYEWSNSAGVVIGTTASINTATAGTFTVIVTDMDNGCTETLTVDADDTTADPMVDVVFTGELNCDISQLTLDGGNSSTGNNFTYQWSDVNGPIANATDLTLDVIAPGDYTLQVSNTFNGCTSTQLVNVTQDVQEPDVQANASTNLLTCTDPSATLDGSGSSIGANFSYQWFEVSGMTPMLIGETINFNVEIAGTYELIVTNSDNGCTAVSTQVVIDQSSDVPVAVIDDADDLTCVTTTLTLNGGNSTAGGMISYEWTDDNSVVLGIDETLDVTTPGTVNLTITDGNNGCTSTATYIVVQDIEAPQVTVEPGDVINCNQPVYTLDGSGSTLDPNITYNFEWTLLGTGVVGTDLVIPDVDQEGMYELVVTNSVNGCTSTAQVEVTADFEEPVADAGNGFIITCADDTAPLNGSNSSSTGDFSYVWLNQVGDTIATEINAETQQNGLYTIVVTNNENGCSSSSTPILVDINVDLPNVELGAAPTITCNNNQEVTLDGSASASGNEITYQWYLNNVAIPNATDVFLTTTDPGDYTLEVTNTATGCADQLSQTIDTDLDAPIATVAGNGGTLICGQASLTLDGSGSSTGPEFTYAWIDVSNGNVVWTEAIYEATAAGTYVLEVTDTSNGCSTTSNQVTVTPDQDAPTLAFATVETLTCNVLTTPIDASGSSAVVGNLIYEWTDANSMVVGNDPTLDVSAPGQYTLTITDDMNNCSASQAITVQQDITPPVPNAGIGGTLLCDNLPVNLNGGGSTGGDTYQWYDPSGILIPGATDITYAATTPGIYTLEVTNSINGCSATSDVLVGQDTNIPTADVQLNFAATLTCDVLSITADGSGSTAAAGGALEYQWSDGSTNATTSFDSPGTYTLTVFDPSNGCDVSQSFEVLQDISVPTPDISVISGTLLDCDNQSLVFNGSNSIPSVGTQVTYSWTLDGNPLGNMSEVEINTDGTLELVVTNVANGCSASTSENITSDANLPTAFIEPNPDDITCLASEISLSGNGSSVGTQFTYEWTGPGNINGNTTLSPSVDAPGTYILTVFNNDNGCEQSASIIVEAEIDPPLANANSTDQIDCINTEVTLDGNGSATGPNITYQWTTTNGTIVSGANTFTPTVSSAGSYTLEVTNLTNGCIAESSVFVDASNDVPVIGDAQVQIPNCFGENNGSILLDDVTGGEMPYLYSINGSALAPINQFSFLEAGEYEILVQDVNGCESTTSVTIDNPVELQVELPADITIGLGETAELNAQSVGSYDTIFWAHCDTCNVSQLFETPLNTTSYTVTFIDGNGCVATDNITVFVEKGREVFIPNAFAPEGFNNRFHIYAGSEVAFASEFRIFNRWGEQVFSVENFDPKIQDSSNGWDGTFNRKDLNPGVFVYYARVVFIDGRVEILKGDVTLRR